MPILKINGFKILNVNFDEKLIINNSKVRKGDIIYYRCDICGHTDDIIFRSHSGFKNKFFSDKIICSTCTRKKTNLKKYGVENLSQSKEIQEKIKENSIKKYGTNHFLSAKEVRDKIDATNLEKYGTTNILQSKEIKQKSKETMIKNHGVEFSLQSEEIRNKFKKSMINKYGSQYAMHSFQIKEKRRTSMQSNIENKIFSFIHISPQFKKEEFMGINKFYKWKCNSCFCIFEDHLDYGHIPRCPHCNPKKVKVNRKKQEMAKWIKMISNNINIKFDYNENISPYEIGIYLPDYHLGIDVLSLYWDSEAQGKDKEYLISKTAICAAAGIQLLSIFEDEWTMKQKIIRSLIKHKIGLYGNTIQANNCIIKEITNKDAQLFYERNHIQGNVNSQLNFALIHETEGMVSCLGISKPRFNQNYVWEVIRFANRLNIHVMNSFNTLFKYFISIYSGSVIAYGDCRYFDSSIYENAGFVSIGQSESNYFYTNYNERKNRLQFQKGRLKNKLKYFDPELTEWQNMQMNDWDRIWDCGSSVYVYSKNNDINLND